MTLSNEDMDLIFRNARTQNGWQPKPVSDAQLRELYELMKWAPTTMNTNPARILFLRSAAAKERLKPALSPGNVDKTMAAPVTADHRLRHPILRTAAETFSAQPERARHIRRRGEEGARGEDRVPQRFDAGRLLHPRRPLYRS